MKVIAHWIETEGEGEMIGPVNKITWQQVGGVTEPGR
jgi:hypothetical protein